MDKMNEKDVPYREGDWGPKYIFRGPLLELGLIRLLPSQSLGTHYHRQVEEIFYCLRGAPLLLVEGLEHRVKEGDAFRVQAMERHDIRNDTGDVIDFLFIKSPYLPEDKVTC